MLSRTRHRIACAVALVTCLVVARVADAQVQAGVDATRDRTTYHFDNPSSITTSELVPHFFEQFYTRDNLWITAADAYRAGVDWFTDAGVTPTRTARATDYDTFFNPDGTVWVAGTTGDAPMHAWRVGQQFRIGRIGAAILTGGYRLRVDHADFLAGDRTVTRDGVLVSRDVVTTREYTTAQEHDLFVGARGARSLSPGWELQLTGELAPAAVQRLSIELPDKYPGRTLVFRTTSSWAMGAAELRRTRGSVPIALRVHAGRMFNYRSTQQVRRTTLGTEFSVVVRR